MNATRSGTNDDNKVNKSKVQKSNSNLQRKSTLPKEILNAQL